jgi:ectoine hydroxylase-related dioxygenase (phytanoyl-CoA dioxygenase family)
LRFLRGSHLGPSRYRPTLFVIDEPLPGTEGEVPPQLDHDDPGVFGFDLDAGDLTIHHSAALHAAGGNRTAIPRRALSIRYCGEDAVVRVKPGAPPKPGFDEVAPGTPLAEAAERLGLHEANTAS